MALLDELRSGADAVGEKCDAMVLQAQATVTELDEMTVSVQRAAADSGHELISELLTSINLAKGLAGQAAREAGAASKAVAEYAKGL